MINSAEYKNYLANLTVTGTKRRVRLLALFSANITLCQPELTKTMLRYLYDCSLDRNAIYETILQSYLFLGFPRMIEAALLFNEVYGDFRDSDEVGKISETESSQWFDEGSQLIRQVYGDNYEILKSRFRKVSPEIFRWMMIEGYGKVLSRPGLTPIERELAEVAALTVDRRERQLNSHIRGSLNMGADISLVEKVIEDIKPLAGDEAFALARRLVDEIVSRYEKKK